MGAKRQVARHMPHGLIFYKKNSIIYIENKKKKKKGLIMSWDIDRITAKCAEFSAMVGDTYDCPMDASAALWVVL